MFNNYNYQTSAKECDECITRGICSVNSTLTSVQEIILLYMKELSFYLLKLKKFGITNNAIKDLFISSFFNILTNAEYNQEQFHNLIETLYNYIQQSKTLYEKTCLEQNVEIETTKSYFKYSKNFNLTDAIRKGEKYFLKKTLTFSQRQKDFYDITLFLIKSLCLKITELQKLGKDCDESYYEILYLLNSIGPGHFSEEEAKKEIEYSINIYYELVKTVFYTQIELYGDLRKTEVSFSTFPGKAILVSGTDFKKLENVLKATEGTGINVYTHGIEMLVAHAFPKLQAHPNLKGHYGAGMDSSLMDFASFPGAILMTKGSLQKVEYLYRGRLFTLDPIAPQGIVKIKDNNFEPLIKSALDAKGFTTGQKKPPMNVGYDRNEAISLIENIAPKMKTGEIKNLFIVGLLNAQNQATKEYFDQFFNLLPDDSYVISMCYPSTKENVYHLNSFYDYSFLYKIIKEFKQAAPLNELNITSFLTRCDKHTLSNLLYLKGIGIKNVYSCHCPPALINPSLMTTLQEVFGIKEMTTVQNDLNIILKNE